MKEYHEEIFMQILQEAYKELQDLRIQKLPLPEFRKKVAKIKFKAGLKFKKIQNRNLIKKSHKRNCYGNI